MSDLTVYNTAGSTNGWRVSAYLKHKGIEHKYNAIDLQKGEHLSEDYVSKFPRHQVPSVEFNGVPVYESVSILLFLETQYKEKSLIPENPADLATMYVRLGELQNKLDSKGIIGSIAFRGKTKEDLATEIEALKKELTVWETNLQGREYLANTLSLADFAVLPNLYIAKILGATKEAYPNINAWVDRLFENEAISSTDIMPVWDAFLTAKGLNREQLATFLA